MPAHYVYRDPSTASLNQGDVLKKTEGLIAHLDQYHKYYANHADYKYFMVVTQTCDLVRRDGACKSPYITLAAVRPLEEVLRREAAKHQTDWQRDAGVIGKRAEEKLVLFLSSLIDNNQDGYFYLHQDVGLGIQQNCCAFLPLSVTLKVEHYHLCLDAKIAELTDTFQAKLGSIIGQMYSRVAAPEWDENYPDNKVGKVVAGMLKRNFRTIDDDKIAEGEADLKSDGRWGNMSPTEKRDYITRFKITPKRDQIKERALEWFCQDDNKLIELLRARLQGALRNDPVLAGEIDALLDGAAVLGEKKDQLSGDLIHKFMERLRVFITDGAAPAEKRSVLDKQFTQLLQDAEMRKILSDM
jgi:hypothetical protein